MVVDYTNNLSSLNIAHNAKRWVLVKEKVRKGEDRSARTGKDRDTLETCLTGGKDSPRGCEETDVERQEDCATCAGQTSARY